MVGKQHLTLVAVEWADAHADNASWMTLADLDDEPCLVCSVGILLAEAKQGHIVLAQSAHSFADGLDAARLDSLLCIPVEMVRAMRVLSRWADPPAAHG